MCFVFVLAFVSFAQAQKVKTVTGYLCGSDNSGNYFGTIYLRVGTKTVEIAHQFRKARGEGGRATRYLNNPDFDNIGSEFVVQYKIKNGYNTAAISIKFTGRVKKTKPCSIN